MERVRYRFLGHVQHRGFRFACVMAARDAGACGWVRNERDGTVTAEVQGSAEAQAAFVKKLSEVVTGFGDTWTVGSEKSMDTIDGETDFSVRRSSGGGL